MKRVLTGIKPTGVPHVGNVLGAIEPALALTREPGFEAYLFIADLHALTTRPDPTELRQQTNSVAATWLALGLDPEKVCFYRQSQVPQIPELAWMLSCSLPMGLLNRAHSIKDAMAKGQTAEELNHGLFAYPVLMAADILAFDANVVPVGRDQKQHLEIAQEAARKFNLRYGEVLIVPEAKMREATMKVPGLDGEKMSKSRHNTLMPFEGDKAILKRIKSVKTDSTAYGAPLSTEEILFQIAELLAPPDVSLSLRRQYESGRRDPERRDGPDGDTSNHFGWGDAKKALHQIVLERFSGAREAYEGWMADEAGLEALLRKGEQRARATAERTLARARAAVGLPAGTA
ncbi:MAG: tryptophan--tRNA ligase [Myxococcota bacterium]